MSRHRKSKPCPTNCYLGSLVSDARQMHPMTLKELAKRLRITHKQLEHYESGQDMIPIVMLENITEILSERVPKRMIRKIMKIRHLEPEKREDLQQELIDLYRTVFEELDILYDDLP